MPELSMKPTATKVDFKLSDDITVTLKPGDSPETLTRKLRRVLSLAEPELPVVKFPETFSPGTAAPFPAGTNGWRQYAEAPEVPDRLQGEVELIDPNEEDE